MNEQENHKQLVHSLTMFAKGGFEADSFRVTSVIPDYVECLRDIGNGSGTGDPKSALFDEAKSIVGKSAAGRIRTRAKKVIEWMPEIRTREAYADRIEESSVSTEADLDRMLAATPRGQRFEADREAKKAQRQRDEALCFEALAALSDADQATLVLRKHFECSYDRVQEIAAEMVDAIGWVPEAKAS